MLTVTVHGNAINETKNMLYSVALIHSRPQRYVTQFLPDVACQKIIKSGQCFKELLKK